MRMREKGGERERERKTKRESEREREKWPNLICLDKHVVEINEYSCLTR